MTISEILQSLRDCDYAECKEWADAIEGAMREPVAEVINGGGCWELQVLGSIDNHIDHGMKLFTLPPDAAGEIERLTRERDAQAHTASGLFDACKERDAEIERLRKALDIIERWEDFPESGCTWGEGTPMSYGAAFGSIGERDYMRGIARAALDKKESA